MQARGYISRGDLEAISAALDATEISALVAHLRARRPSLKLVCVEEQTSLRDVLGVLNKHSILAVPVYRDVFEDDEGVSSSSSSKEQHQQHQQQEGVRRRRRRRVYVSIVSVYDVLAWTVLHRGVFDAAAALDTAAGQGTTAAGYRAADALADAYFSAPVASLVGLTAESAATWCVHSSEPLSALLAMITTQPCHRMLVIDDDAIAQSALLDDADYKNDQDGGSVVMITQQMDVLDFIYTFRDSLHATAISRVLDTSAADVEALVKNFGGAAAPANSTAAMARVVRVPVTWSALAAFREMYVRGVSAVAVVADDSSNGNGSSNSRIVANLSASDLRGLTASMDSLGSLLLPVFEFLEMGNARRAPGAVKADQLRCVDADDRLESAVQIALQEHVHRVWIELGEDNVTGVLTVGDMLSMFRPNLPIL
ncbi:hypothetical protein HDU82_008294 [Entophlyctis luteolus]|nr:hypothetical protein HDU82_008294 [Entophlyctis luteolus]KAJ3381435.1 hypothetical protein HDU84_005124 [Entophlyctis sp. JEL0112]